MMTMPSYTVINTSYSKQVVYLAKGRVGVGVDRNCTKNVVSLGQHFFGRVQTHAKGGSMDASEREYGREIVRKLDVVAGVKKIR